MNNRNLLLNIFLITLLLISPDAYSRGGDTQDLPIDQPAETPTDGQPSTVEQTQAQGALDAGEDFSGAVPTDTGLTLPTGETVTAAGELNIEAGEVAYSESLSYNDASIEGAHDFTASAGAYSVGSVERLTHAGSTITSGSGITYSNGILSAEHADSLLSPGGVSANVDLFSSETAFPFRVYLSKADSVLANDIRFEDARDSTFDIYGNGVKVTAAAGVIHKITDNAGNSLEFKAMKNNSNVSIIAADPPRYQVEAGTLSFRYDDVTETVVANDTAIIEMGALGFKCMQITAVGSYWHTTIADIEKDFGVTVPAYGKKYKLCLNKLSWDASPHSDGLVDYPDKKIRLDGIVTYLRFPFDSGTYSLIPKAVYEGHSAKAVTQMYFDDDFIYIEDFVLKGEYGDGHLATTRFGYFEYLEANSSTFMKYNTEYYPNTIKLYSTTFYGGEVLNDPGSISFTGYGRKASVNALSPGTEKVDRAIEFMKERLNRDVNMTLFEYLVVG